RVSPVVDSAFGRRGDRRWARRGLSGRAGRHVHHRLHPVSRRWRLVLRLAAAPTLVHNQRTTMAKFNERELEALESYRRYVAQRERCVAGEAPWSTIGEWFTEDAVFIDPAWGRVEGRDEIARFLDRSMVGFGEWSFPEEW